MKNRRLITAVLTAAFGILALATEAQTTQRTNIERQPDWGPVGYELAEFYYIPALDVYYDVGKAVFRIEENGRWVEVAALPERFSEYDLYACYKVVMNGDAPWRNHTNHTFVYDDYRNKRFRQQTIRASREPDGKDKGVHNPKRERRQREKEGRRSDGK